MLSSIESIIVVSYGRRHETIAGWRERENRVEVMVMVMSGAGPILLVVVSKNNVAMRRPRCKNPSKSTSPAQVGSVVAEEEERDRRHGGGHYVMVVRWKRILVVTDSLVDDNCHCCG